MTKPLNIAMIGYGFMGRESESAIDTLPDHATMQV